MNRIFLLAVTMLLIFGYAKAQSEIRSNNINVGNKPSEPAFKITKGYYSIYRNTEKLNQRPIPITIKHKDDENNYNKGFYAIGSKHTQLHPSGKSFIVTTPKRPLATKGYYSIKPQNVNNSEENLMAEITDTTKIAQEEN